MQQIVIFGAGNVGRGFVAQLFGQAGYKIIFVDVHQPLVDALNERGTVTIQLVTNQESRQVTVGPIAAILASDRQRVTQAIVEANIGVTAVGARALPYVASNVAAGIARRVEQGVQLPLNLLTCENLHDAAGTLRRMVKADLPPALHSYLDSQVGFVATVIGRMIAPLPPHLQAKDPTLTIAEPYQELPIDAAAFIGSPPTVAGLVPVSPFSFYADRKLYIHNGGHAVLGYLGYQQGYEAGYAALADPYIATAVRGAMLESQQALEKKYALPAGQLLNHVDELLARFENRALGDTILRLSRDPIRKLGRNDRLIGAAMTALEYGIEPTWLVVGVVAALHFDHSADPLALQLQQELQNKGLDGVLQQVCGLDLEFPLAWRIRSRFAQAGTPRA